MPSGFLYLTVVWNGLSRMALCYPQIHAVVYVWPFIVFMWTALLTITEVTFHRMRFMSQLSVWRTIYLPKTKDYYPAGFYRHFCTTTSWSIRSNPTSWISKQWFACNMYLNWIHDHLIISYMNKKSKISLGCHNEARLRLLTREKKTLEALRLTQALWALSTHPLGDTTGQLFWNQVTSVHQDIPDFPDWGDTWTTVVGCLSEQILVTAARQAHFFCIVAVRNNAQVTASAADLG